MHKALIILMIISSVYPLRGQRVSDRQCAAWISIKTDSTGRESLTAKEETFVTEDGKTGLNIYSFLNASRKVVVISIQAIGGGSCVDKGDKVIILMEDGEELNLANTNDFNCDGSSTVYFGGALGKHNEIQSLSSKKIKTMRVWTRDDYMQKTFSDAQAVKLKETLRCLAASLVE